MSPDVSSKRLTTEGSHTSSPPQSPLPQVALLIDTLQMHGYKPTIENIEMLNQMLSSGIPLTKENIAHMYQAFKITQHMNSAVFLLRNNISPTPKNAMLLKSLIEGQAQITNQIANLIEGISQLQDLILQANLIKLFETLQYSNEAKNLADSMQHTQNISKAATKNIRENATTDSITSPTTIANKVTIATTKNLSVLNPISTSDQVKTPSAATITTESYMTQAATESTIQAPHSSLSDTLMSANYSSLEKNQQAPSLQAEANKNLDANPLTTGEGLDRAFTDTNEFFTTTSYTLQALHKSMSIPLQSNTVKEVERFINGLREVLSLAQLAMSSSTDDTGASRVMEDIQILMDHIDLASQIKNQIFVQIPVTVEGQTFNTTLYVNKDSDGQKKTNGSGSALIALDTISLGHFETYVQKEAQSVRCQFRLENEETEYLVRANIHRLDALLKDHRYNLESFTFLIGDKHFSVLDILQNENLVYPTDTVFDTMA